MITLDALEALARDGALERCLLPPDAGLQDWPVVTLDEVEALRFGHGNPVPGTIGPAAGLVRVYGPGARLLGLGEVTPGRILEARRVMQLQGRESA
jgi:tRNA pseudouridine55 synthase